jgi:hypothetical protein
MEDGTFDTHQKVVIHIATASATKRIDQRLILKESGEQAISCGSKIIDTWYE